MANGYYLEKYVEGAVKYRVLDKQKKKVSVISKAMFTRLLEGRFITEDTSGPIKKYFISQKAFNYQFKKLTEDEKQKKHASREAPVV